MRKSHASWNGYRESFAVKLQEWDSLSESVELETSDGLFPIRSEAEVQTAHESREEVMSKGRKVDGVLLQILQDTSRYCSDIRELLGMDKECEFIFQIPI